MVNLRVVHGIWDRTSFAKARHGWSPVVPILRKCIYVGIFSDDRPKIFPSHDKSHDHSKLFAPSLPNSVTCHSFSTTDQWLAKSKNRGKDNKKLSKVRVNLKELSEIINVEKLSATMEEAVNDLKINYSKNLTLRSSIGSIEQISVTWEGKEYKLQELSNITRRPKTVVINVATFPQVIPSILQSIAKSGMNLNPQQDGTSLFVPIPKVTREHRENLAKNAKALFIECRDNVKDIQLRSVKSLKTKTNVSEDVIRNTQSQLRALADEFINEAEAILKMKLQELLKDSD